MFKAFKSLGAAVALAVGVSAAQATVILPGSETPLQTVIEGLYESPTCPRCSPVSAAPNVNTDQYGSDELWAVNASGGSVATIVIEIAGNAGSNAFGVYNPYTGNAVQLFAGAADQTDQALLSIGADGSVSVVYLQRNASGSVTNVGFNNFGAGYFSGNVFGYYLDTPGGTFYSESHRNPGGADQMVAFRGDEDLIAIPGNPSPAMWGTESFILAWEDIAYASSDRDFNDFVVYVESVRGLPEPGTLALLGLGLAGLGLARRRRG